MSKQKPKVIIAEHHVARAAGIKSANLTHGGHGEGGVWLSQSSVTISSCCLCKSPVLATTLAR